jgi:hypothetical protein
MPTSSDVPVGDHGALNDLSNAACESCRTLKSVGANAHAGRKRPRGGDTEPESSARRGDCSWVGPDLARSLIDLALIDEYRLHLCPVVAGRPQGRDGRYNHFEAALREACKFSTLAPGRYRWALGRNNHSLLCVAAWGQAALSGGRAQINAAPSRPLGSILRTRQRTPYWDSDVLRHDCRSWGNRASREV